MISNIIWDILLYIYIYSYDVLSSTRVSIIIFITAVGTGPPSFQRGKLPAILRGSDHPITLEFELL